MGVLRSILKKLMVPLRILDGLSSPITLSGVAVMLLVKTDRLTSSKVSSVEAVTVLLLCS